jgi:hypothetical protein
MQACCVSDKMMFRVFVFFLSITISISIQNDFEEIYSCDEATKSTLRVLLVSPQKHFLYKRQVNSAKCHQSIDAMKTA